MNTGGRRGVVFVAVLFWAAYTEHGSGQELAKPLERGAESDETWARARASLARGKALFDVENYDAALAEFLVAHRLLDGHPRQYIVLHNIAACHERMFRYDSALHFYQLYLEQGGTDAEDRVQIESVVRAMNGLLARVSVQSNVAADVWIDDRPAGRAPGTLRVPPGKHLIELRAPVREPSRREVYVQAGASLSLRFELSRLSQYRGLHPAYFWTGTGLTALALGAGSAFGLNALAQSSAGRDRRRQDAFLNTAADERAVHQNAVAADLAFASAALFGVTSLVLFFLSDWSDSDKTALSATSSGASLKLRGDL
jgi:tetratricopeptide (TPR) repeat protein